MVKQELKKYSQRLNIIIAVTGAILGSLPLLQDNLGSYYGWAFVVTSVISAACISKKQDLSNV